MDGLYVGIVCAVVASRFSSFFFTLFRLSGLSCFTYISIFDIDISPNWTLTLNNLVASVHIKDVPLRPEVRFFGVIRARS